MQEETVRGGEEAQEFHAIPIETLLADLNTSANGLTSDESRQRHEVYGYNDISRIKRQPIIIQYLEHFKNLLVVILLVAALVSAFVGQIMSATIIGFIIIASVTLDFFQQYKAENAADLLRQKISTLATVRRDGKRQEIRISELVPGDLIYLNAGDIVPADARLLEARDFFVNQSALTGEPYPVEKAAIQEGTKTPLIEAADYIFLGTSVVSGTAAAVATRIGSETEFGKIAQTLVQRPPETEFERGLKQFSYLMTRFVFFLVIFVFFINALFKHNVLEALLFSIALAVGMTPELLPMILSLNLSQGSIAMSKKGAIVKHPESIQNIGSMDVLCTDKTGTLTENSIALIKHLDVEGKESEKVLLYSYLNSTFQTGLKSPLDEAIIGYRQIDIAGYRKIDEIPFDFIRKRLSIAVTDESLPMLISKGAPEEIFQVCSSVEEHDGRIEPMADDAREKINHLYQTLSADGFRTLAVCYRPLPKGVASVSAGDEKDMILLGLIAFIDPPKESARESVQMLISAGIEPKILTGDNELVTRKICEYIGLEVKGILTGGEIAHMDDEALARVIEDATIFTRVNPIQKDRIMSALRRNGHVVGFIGDGINDAPSIRSADVGISVDTAVDIAKESADIILLEKDLRVLHDGVLEGRKTFGNTIKYILMGTSSNFGNMFSVAGASLFLPFLPMLPIQILLNNLLYSLSQFAIPTDNVDAEYIATPKAWNMGFIQKFILIFGPVSSVFDFITFFILLYLFNADASLFQTAWFIESISTQTLVIFVIRTRIIPFYASKPSRLLLGSTLLIVVISCVLPFTIIGSIFGFVHPPISFFAVLAGLVIGYLTVTEFTKRWFYRRYTHLFEKGVSRS
jgi:Mg2+-importing ATPase